MTHTFEVLFAQLKNLDKHWVKVQKFLLVLEISSLMDAKTIAAASQRVFW